MRVKGNKLQLEYLKMASESNKLNTLFRGLDVLGFTGWKINKRVFHIILQAWNSLERYPCIPPAHGKLSLPRKPEDPELFTKWQKETVNIKTQWRNDHSLRCDVNYKVEIARAVCFFCYSVIVVWHSFTTMFSIFLITSTFAVEHILFHQC